MQQAVLSLLILIAFLPVVHASDWLANANPVVDAKALLKVNLLGKENSDWNSPANCAVLAGTRPIPPMPWRNQGWRGWCFADSSADLATMACGRFISATDIALTSLRRGNRKPTDDGGEQIWALKESKKNGFCSEDSLPEKNFAKLKSKEYILKVDAIEKAARRHVATCAAMNAASSIFGLTMQTAAILRKAGGADVIQQLADNKCKPRIRNCAKSFSGSALFTDPQQKQAIAITMEELRHGRPVSIGLDITALLNPQAVAAETKELQRSDPSAKVSNGHAMTAVGLEFNSKSGKCELKLRNSWGGDCGDFDRKKVRCDQENVWAPVDSIAEGIDSIAFITESGVNDKEQFNIDVPIVIPDTPE